MRKKAAKPQVIVRRRPRVPRKQRRTLAKVRTRRRAKTKAPPARPRPTSVPAAKKKPAAKPAQSGHWVSKTELTCLRDNLREAQETIHAIRSGEVDAVIMNGDKGRQIYSLTSAEEPYRIYVERMQEGAATVSASALILYCNQKFADMLQLPLEQVIGSLLTAHLPAAAWQVISGIFDSRADVVKHESALQGADGTSVPTHLTANRLPQEDQTVMCLIVTDLTEQKKLEKSRLDKDLAEKACLAKDDFLAALSHELRTPLTPVLMTVVALDQNPALPEALRESLGLIRRNVELEARLIDDLLDLTRISRGKLEFHLKEFDFHLLVQRAVEICRPDFMAKSQTVILQLEATEIHTEGDATRVQQAMWNLIRNATKFTGPEGTITIRTSNPAPDKISFAVTDTGIGFEPGLSEKLFQAFEQGGRTITRQFGGLGLGLAISRSIAQGHQGTITAFSAGPGQGATFTLEFPVRIAPPMLAAKVPSAPPEAEKTVALRILLVEDHADTRNSLEFLLKKNMHEVRSAASAEEALDLADAHTFDLVISDIGLPGQNGWELMRQLKKKFKLTGIALSGYGMEDDFAKSLTAGFIRHFTKPFNFEHLKQAIAGL